MYCTVQYCMLLRTVIIQYSTATLYGVLYDAVYKPQYTAWTVIKVVFSPWRKRRKLTTVVCLSLSAAASKAPFFWPFHITFFSS